MRTFLVLAEELNYGRAAQRLRIAQPAVSQQIITLEKSLKVRLFDRNTRSVALTDAGMAFLQPCRDAVNAVENAGLEAQNAGTGEFGRIRIGFNAGFTANALSALMRSIRKKYPRLQLEVDSSRRNTEVLDRVEARMLDIGLVGGPLTGRDLDSLPVSRNGLGVILPRDHPMAGRSEVKMADLADEPFVLIAPADGPTIRSAVLELCSRAGFQPHIAAEAGDGLTIQTLVVAGVGVGFSAGGSSDLNPANVVELPVIDSEPVTCSLVWKRGPASPALENVLRVAGERFSAEDWSLD